MGTKMHSNKEEFLKGIKPHEVYDIFNVRVFNNGRMKWLRGRCGSVSIFQKNDKDVIVEKLYGFNETSKTYGFMDIFEFNNTDAAFKFISDQWGALMANN